MNKCGLWPVQGSDKKDDVKPLELDVYGRMLAEAVLEDRTDHLVDGGSRRPGYSDSNAVALSIMGEAEGIRVRLIRMMEDDPDDIQTLIELFRLAPVHIHGHLRLNIMKLARDRSLNSKQKKAYLRSLVDANLQLLLQLDHMAFPARGVEQGFPPYLSDMFTDLGPDSRKYERHYEKYCLSKRDIFDIHRDLIFQILTTDEDKKSTIERMAKAVRGSREYARFNAGMEGIPSNATALLGSTMVVAIRNKIGIGVCRHDALDFQALAQIAGIESRVLPCMFDGGSHYANIVRINNEWHILDVTNPDGKKVFLRYINAPHFDPDNLRNTDYTWNFGMNGGGKYRAYRTHNQVYNEIKPPDYEFQHSLGTTDVVRVRQAALAAEAREKESDRLMAQRERDGKQWLGDEGEDIFRDGKGDGSGDEYDPFDPPS